MTAITGYLPRPASWHERARTRWERMWRRRIKRLQIAEVEAELRTIDRRQRSLERHAARVEEDIERLRDYRRTVVQRLRDVEGGR